MVGQWYAPLMAALVEKAPYLGYRLIDTATFADQRGRRLVVVAADRQPGLSSSLERGQFVNQGIRRIAVPLESGPPLNSEMLDAMLRDCLLGEVIFPRE